MGLAETAHSGCLECESSFEKKICVTPLAPHSWPDPSIVCASADIATVNNLKAVAKDFSEPFQKVLCSLDKIFIIGEPGGTAFGSYTPDAAGKFHSFLGINSAVLKKSPTLSDWSSWKEQLSFGGNPEPVHVSTGLPVVDAMLPGIQNDFLFFVLSHEMGHILDFANSIRSAPICKPGPDKDCEMDTIGFGHFSWKTTFQILPEVDFLERIGLCFYQCNGKFLDWSKSSTVYEDLFQHGFISLYSSTNSADDFAESVAYYNLSQIKNGQYRIITPEGKSYFPLDEYRKGALLKKFEFIGKFFERKDIVYGGSDT